MYSTCVFCNANLGANESIEVFPVGRRLAFDAARGRLWVVCRRCERWNLSPLEERWEAIEEAERLFRDTRLRVSTANIGLARLKEGLELVRVGAPKRPEMAAWRYGDQFGRRRKRMMMQAGLGLGAVAALTAGGAAVGVGVGGFAGFLWQMAEVAIYGTRDSVVARVNDRHDGVREVKRSDLGKARLGRRDGKWILSLKLSDDVLEFTGEEGIRAVGALLPAMNRFGGSRAQVQTAVELLEQSGDPRRYFDDASRAVARRGYAKVCKLGHPVRLALEMAAHEEAERRALQGELAELERAWREAEEVAGISDSLLLPREVEQRLERLRGLMKFR